MIRLLGVVQPLRDLRVGQPLRQHLLILRVYVSEVLNDGDIIAVQQGQLLAVHIHHRAAGALFQPRAQLARLRLLHSDGHRCAVSELHAHDLECPIAQPRAKLQLLEHAERFVGIDVSGAEGVHTIDEL